MHVGYKLYESEGIVVDSGEILTDPLAVGKTTKNSFWISDLDPHEEYTLKLMDVSKKHAQFFVLIKVMFLRHFN